MLTIDEKKDECFRTLRHERNVFHNALRYVAKGEYRFHVTDDTDISYDLVYKDNHALLCEAQPMAKSLPSVILPPYLTYDENAEETLYLEILEDFDEIVFEEVNEYSVTLARLILEKTDKRVIFFDERIAWFLAPSKALCVVSQEIEKTEKTLTVCKECENLGGVVTGCDNVMSAVALFHNIFLWQWMTDLRPEEVRYACVSVLKTEGIGAIIDHFIRMKNLFAKRNISTFLMKGCTRFRDEMLQRLFRFETLPKDADETNTIFLYNFLPLRLSEPFYRSESDASMEMLNDRFVAQIEEYYEAVFGGKKVLGVLIRGTDYINLKIDGVRRQATADEMIPVIDEWMEEGGYEKIFLATEDADILHRMREYYGNKLLAVSQRRYRVSDFSEGQFLSDLEKQEHKENYEAEVEDTTVNYYYALVILSKCSAFMVSGQCNGWDVVNALNGGRFERTLRCGGESKA